VARDYDLFIIGAGSAGVRAARQAARAGARVAIAEADRVGGTCVLRGCIPKKLLAYAAQFSELFEDSIGYGWTYGDLSFDWPTLIAYKDREIARLESVYRRTLAEAGVELIESRAVLEGAHTIHLERDDRAVTADHVLIATGGRPNPHAALEGNRLCITSDEAFHLERLPKRILIGGGGYVAAEFAGIFSGLGVETIIVSRGREVLSRFDADLRRMFHSEVEAKGVRILTGEIFTRIERLPDGRRRAHFARRDPEEVDAVMLAIGRLPNVERMGLEQVGVARDQRGAIRVDEYSRTTIDHIYAIGDVTDRMQLTPVAIHEAMCFVETVFRGRPTKPDYDTVPTAVFSNPEIGTVGLPEHDARLRHQHLDIYRSVFRPLKGTLSGRPDRMLMKLIVDAETDIVLGAHILGPGAAEMIQLLAVPIKMHARKADFDATMALHPTAAEEMLTFAAPSERIRNGETLAA
jgi:glutathione reductase (NADPH)